MRIDSGQDMIQGTVRVDIGIPGPNFENDNHSRTACAMKIIRIRNDGSARNPSGVAQTQQNPELAPAFRKTI
ncbi:hypothetical protein [Castellaniella sp.]|uniref:hypothetical protein n=1 Tax=Castellaniella sp. TaxID=1955812 RepID=UPI0035600187